MVVGCLGAFGSDSNTGSVAAPPTQYLTILPG